MTGPAYDAATRPPIPILTAHGEIFHCCYTDGNYATPLNYVAALHAAGEGVLANHERATDQLLSGYTGGKQAATDALAAVTAWGEHYAPSRGLAIVFSVDVSVSPANYPLVGAAFDAINTVLAGRYVATCYGQGGLIDYLVQTGRIKAGYKSWLSASSSFPGFNPASPNVGLVQLIGTDIPGTDRNRVTNLNGLGVSWPAGHTESGIDAVTIIAPPKENQLKVFTDNDGTGLQWVSDGAEVHFAIDSGDKANTSSFYLKLCGQDAPMVASADELTAGYNQVVRNRAALALAVVAALPVASSAPPAPPIDAAVLDTELAAAVAKILPLNITTTSTIGPKA